MTVAGEQAQTAGATDGQASGQSSSGTSSQSSQTAGSAAQAGASDQTTQQQTNQQTQQAEAPQRPDWVPDQFWDDKAGVKGKDLRTQFDQLSQFHAAEQVRRNSLPASPDAYKLELGKDFVMPEGMGEWKFDEADPLLPQARQVMHDIDTGKISGQEAFSKLLGLYAAAQVGDAQKIKTARDGEVAKLGANGPARVDAVINWARATVGDADAKALSSMLVTAGHVTAFENLIKKFAGASNGFSPQHREQSNEGKLSDADYDKLTPRQKMEYAQKFPQPGQTNGRAA